MSCKVCLRDEIMAKASNDSGVFVGENLSKVLSVILEKYQKELDQLKESQRLIGSTIGGTLIEKSNELKANVELEQEQVIAAIAEHMKVIQDDYTKRMKVLESQFQDGITKVNVQHAEDLEKLRKESAEKQSKVVEALQEEQELKHKSLKVELQALNASSVVESVKVLEANQLAMHEYKKDLEKQQWLNTCRLAEIYLKLYNFKPLTAKIVDEKSMFELVLEDNLTKIASGQSPVVEIEAIGGLIIKLIEFYSNTPEVSPDLKIIDLLSHYASVEDLKLLIYKFVTAENISQLPRLKEKFLKTYKDKDPDAFSEEEFMKLILLVKKLNLAEEMTCYLKREESMAAKYNWTKAVVYAVLGYYYEYNLASQLWAAHIREEQLRVLEVQQWHEINPDEALTDESLADIQAARSAAQESHTSLDPEAWQTNKSNYIDKLMQGANNILRDLLGLGQPNGCGEEFIFVVSQTSEVNKGTSQDETCSLVSVDISNPILFEEMIVDISGVKNISHPGINSRNLQRLIEDRQNQNTSDKAVP